ncbi:hypothetical protein BKA69DRAFT_1163720 [Paraphysoderma sedebokerense]|nr:hypothetical protein BKA69DRAFT_1163720 [Paraphysoderma sedebokerense]
MSDLPSSPNFQKLESYLNKKARLTVTDGRKFIGRFMCIDKHKNIILSHAEELKDCSTRYVNLVMIPGKHLVKAEFEEEMDDGDDSMYI